MKESIIFYITHNYCIDQAPKEALETPKETFPEGRIC